MNDIGECFLAGVVFSDPYFLYPYYPFVDPRPSLYRDHRTVTKAMQSIDFL